MKLSYNNSIIEIKTEFMSYLILFKPGLNKLLNKTNKKDFMCKNDQNFNCDTAWFSLIEVIYHFRNRHLWP